MAATTFGLLVWPRLTLATLFAWILLFMNTNLGGFIGLCWTHSCCVWLLTRGLIGAAWERHYLGAAAIQSHGTQPNNNGWNVKGVDGNHSGLLALRIVSHLSLTEDHLVTFCILNCSLLYLVNKVKLSKRPCCTCTLIGTHDKDVQKSLKINSSFITIS